MEPELRSTLLKITIPAVAAAVALVVSKKRGVSWTKDLGLVWPSVATVAAWVGAWVLWVILGEIAIPLLGMEEPARWKEYSALVFALRVVAIGVIGPASEEILMRGVVFNRLRRTALGPVGAILVSAAAWAAMHVQYDWMTIVMIFLDGIVLGTARYRSRSTFVAIVMHALGNLYSIYQSTHG